ncbi:MAG: L,D-transpeptidase family protein [Halarcobacter ebronensis]|uniref:L,D-transpeptidase family protein n=1 Tax=Halarcobacter ebronensis TaxID=1462615 RepID=UPI003C78D1CC
MKTPFFIFIIFTFILNSFLYCGTLEVVPSNNERTNKYYYYFNKQYIWIDKNNQIRDIAFNLIKEIKDDKILEPFINKIFNIKKIENLLEHRDHLEKTKSIELDTLLTKTYDQYMNYLARGFINWKSFIDELEKIEEETEIKAKWSKFEVRKNNIKLLELSIEKNNINYALNQVNYTFPYANDLEEEITRLEKIKEAGGYTTIPKTLQPLRVGNFYPQIEYIRKRLYESKDIDSLECAKVVKNCQYYFDEKLFNGVISFQKRYGLITDGVIGKNTIDKLNTPIEEKIKVLRVNLERMRWLPRNLGERYILINIPAYKLKLYEQKKVQLKMNVIVGKKKFPTPIFSHKMSEIIVNPYWKIPQTIVKNEIIPKLAKDSDYLIKENIKVFENWDVNSLEFDVSKVDWNMYVNNDLIGTPKEAPMRFIQTPGGSNPLGRVKFLFPNQYSVYLHDTPEKQYFKMKEKTLSHGCIRLEKPFELFENILTINKDDIKVIEKLEESDYKLNKKIPIHIVYLTAWVENDKLQFRDDIYNYDKIQSKLLFESTF